MPNQQPLYQNRNSKVVPVDYIPDENEAKPPFRGASGQVLDSGDWCFADCRQTGCDEENQRRAVLVADLLNNHYSQNP
jgi:hypothetical protein